MWFISFKISIYIDIERLYFDGSSNAVFLKQKASSVVLSKPSKFPALNPPKFSAGMSRNLNRTSQLVSWEVLEQLGIVVTNAAPFFHLSGGGGGHFACRSELLR